MVEVIIYIHYYRVIINMALLQYLGQFVSDLHETSAKMYRIRFSIIWYATQFGGVHTCFYLFVCMYVCMYVCYSNSSYTISPIFKSEILLESLYRQDQNDIYVKVIGPILRASPS